MKFGNTHAVYASYLNPRAIRMTISVFAIAIASYMHLNLSMLCRAELIQIKQSFNYSK